MADSGKTKAHRTKEEAEELGDLLTWQGNDAADRFAKEAAKAGLAPIAVQNAQDVVLRYWPKLIRAVAALFAIWPLPREAYSAGNWVPRTRPRLGRRIEPSQPHDWAYSNIFRKVVCTRCHKMSDKRRATRCKPLATGAPPIRLARVHASHKMCTLMHEGGRDCLWFCWECGKYAHARTRNLNLACAGPVAVQGEWHVRQLRKGFHPIKGTEWGRPRAGILHPTGLNAGQAPPLANTVQHVGPAAPPDLCRVPAHIPDPQEGDDSWDPHPYPEWDNEVEVEEEGDFLDHAEFFGVIDAFSG